MLFENSDQSGISGPLKQFGAYDAYALVPSAALLNSRSEGKTVLDVGANLGTYSVPMAKSFPDLNFICFEVQRPVFYQLCGNIFLNSINNAHAFNIGLGSTNKKMEICLPDYSADINIGAFSVLQEIQTNIRGNMSRGVTEEIEVVTLDSLGYQDIALIKIDVEGSELNVLKGGLGTIVRSNYPPFIFEAWSLDWYKKDKEQLMQFVLDLGYKITKLGPTDNYLAQHPKRGVFGPTELAESVRKEAAAGRLIPQRK